MTQPPELMDQTTLEEAFKEWWIDSYGMPPRPLAVMTHVSFAEYVLTLKAKQATPSTNLTNDY